MEFYRAELSRGRNVMNESPEGGWREHVGELNTAERGLSMGLCGAGGSDKRGWRIRQRPHSQGPLSPIRVFS